MTIVTITANNKLNSAQVAAIAVRTGIHEIYPIEEPSFFSVIDDDSFLTAESEGYTDFFQFGNLYINRSAIRGIKTVGDVTTVFVGIHSFDVSGDLPYTIDEMLSFSGGTGSGGVDGSGPWGMLPDPAVNNGKIFRLTDTWANNALAYCDGTRWMCDRPVVLYAASPGDVITGTTSLTAFRDVLVPGKLVGKNGLVKIDPIWKYTSNGNAKNAGYRISQTGGVVDGTQMWQHGQSSVSTSSLPLLLSADNSETAQVAATVGATNGSVGQSTAAAEVTAAVDTTQDWYITMTALPASGSDTLILRRLVITVHPGYN